MIKFFIFFLLISCAHQKKDLPADAIVLTKNFSSSKEARNYVRNKWNYLFLLFEQSFDPYYNTPKWPLACLQKNQLGKIYEQSRGIIFTSTFLLNENKEPGHCQGLSTEVIFLHCQDSLSALEIHCSPGQCKHLLSSDICPL